MMKKILTIFGMLMLALMPLVSAGWIDDNGEPSYLVYGRIFTLDGAPANGATYKIRTYDHDNGGQLLSVQTGVVGAVLPGYLYESKNAVDSEGDTVVIEISLNGQTKTILKTVTAQQEELHVIGLGDVRLDVSGGEEELAKKAGSIHIDRFRLTRGEFLPVGEMLESAIAVSNLGEEDLEDVRITVGVPDLGIHMRAGPFDLDDNDDISKELFMEIPEWAQPGDYTIRIDVSNDQIQRVIHREFTVIG
ncbi:hypothetical protein KY311_01250 [Candidatus Woesearchaeota archaeon]|nr:hypothetical protein [Candidatus Woesearchaeota archaeon]